MEYKKIVIRKYEDDHEYMAFDNKTHIAMCDDTGQCLIIIERKGEGDAEPVLCVSIKKFYFVLT